MPSGRVATLPFMVNAMISGRVGHSLQEVNACNVVNAKSEERCNTSAAIRKNREVCLFKTRNWM